MGLFTGISDRFWGYVSPRKTQQRRDKPFKVPPLPGHVKNGKSKSISDPRSMSPTSRIEAWQIKSPSEYSSVGGSGEDFETSPGPAALERTYTDFEGDTLIDEFHEGIGEEQDVDANDETIVVDDGSYEIKDYDPEAERLRREEQGKELLAAGWSLDSVFLFQKLGMRGYEPLMPRDWSFDFVMLPYYLFTEKIDMAFIKPNKLPESHATRALRELFKIGPNARDAVLTKAPKRTAEWQIRNSIRKYYAWARKDGDVHHDWNLPLFETVIGHKDADIPTLQSNMQDKLGALASRWRDAFRDHISSSSQDGVTSSKDSFVRELPTLYGVIASHTIMAFVGYDILSSTRTLRTIAIFDFGQEGFDVWNAFAVAIFVIHCRNRMMELRDDLPVYESEAESDPDA